MEDLFRRYLVGTNWQVIGAANTEEARSLIADTCPVAIVLDLLIPKEDGWEFLLSLRNDTATHDIPVIICSVLEQPALALSLGATAYLPKPVTQQELLRVLKPWSALS